MIDLELERKAFEELSYKNGVRNFTKDDVDGGYCSAELDYNWHIWIKSAESKQAEIDSLKAQLAKVESGEYVVVLKEFDPVLAEKIAFECLPRPAQENDKTWIEIAEKAYQDNLKSKKFEIMRTYKELIEAAQENSHE
ncbi:hypothetical protein [Acinetobacter soli]|uniref:hypothetical protein n=1 Tax=Acinetobacter soli TaxID=487316 RepID=UPI001F448ABB|nr:hypothetical protein [Acinetobacter soli]MCE6007615.1 hypothetical protein [Acinetobacter soli]